MAPMFIFCSDHSAAISRQIWRHIAFLGNYEKVDYNDDDPEVGRKNQNFQNPRLESPSSPFIHRYALWSFLFLYKRNTSKMLVV